MRVGKENVERWILEIIDSQPGLKSTELVAELWSEFKLELTSADVEVVDVIQYLIDTGEIVEQEYSDPGMAYRLKSRYWPKNTDLKTVSPSGHSYDS